jgi:hypothetical protein
MRWREGDSIAVHATSRMPSRRSAPHLERWGGQGGAVRQWVQVNSSQGQNRLNPGNPWIPFFIDAPRPRRFRSFTPLTFDMGEVDVERLVGDE